VSKLFRQRAGIYSAHLWRVILSLLFDTERGMASKRKQSLPEVLQMVADIRMCHVGACRLAQSDGGVPSASAAKSSPVGFLSA
jgi:hypothetical protein